MLKNDIIFQKIGNTMNKLNILLLMLLMVPVFTFLLFSKENTGTVVYLHEQTKTARSNQEHFNQFAATGNVIIDFYADWCTSCVTIDHEIFSQPLILDALKNFILLRVNMTNNTDYDAELLKKLQVIGPPTLLLFKPGDKKPAVTIIGETTASEFKKSIRAVTD